MGMRVVVSLLMALTLLLGSPLAHAVQCVMTKADVPAEWAAMPADCPMFAMAMAEQGKTPALSVADCVKAPALAQAEVAAPEVVSLPAAVLPVEGLALVAPVAVAPLLFKPPPDVRGPSRSVVLLTARWRP